MLDGPELNAELAKRTKEGAIEQKKDPAYANKSHCLKGCTRSWLNGFDIPKICFESNGLGVTDVKERAINPCPLNPPRLRRARRCRLFPLNRTPSQAAIQRQPPVVTIPLRTRRFCRHPSRPDQWRRQIVVAAIAVIGLVYLLKLVLVTILSSVLLAFVLEPFVSRLARIGIPRAAGALLAVVLMVGLAGGLTFFFFSRAVDFATQLPKYSGKIRSSLANLRAQTSKIEESTRSVIASPNAGKPPMAVEIRKAPGLSSLISAGSGRLGEVLLAISFIPFLVYFMLTWKDHAHSSTVRLFPKEHRLVAHRTVGRISTMIRSFIAGNVLVGLVSAAVSTIVFWRLGIPYFYFLGVISGFVSLIPYLGVFLALLPPLAAGIGVVDKTGVGIILLTVIGLHLLSMNVLYPKIVGKRLRLNPLAVTLSLLFWAWIWGAMGLILAVPLVGATKIVCDYVDPLRGLGAWLGD